MRGRYFIIVGLALLMADAWALSARTKAATIFVSPDGPVATLERARDLIRQQKSGVGLKEPMHVVVASGTYMMGAPFVLTPQDSGTEQFDIVYEAAPGANPVFTGGRRITGFQPDTDGAWKARVPEAASGSVVLRAAFRQRPPGRAGPQSEQVLLLHD